MISLNKMSNQTDYTFILINFLSREENEIRKLSISKKSHAD